MLCNETIIFLTFVLIGCIFSIVFDFFRAIRKYNKMDRRNVYIQDILYFIIITIILLVAILNIRQDVFRLYLIVAIVLGIIIYISIIGNKVRDIFVSIFKVSHKIKQFIFIPLELFGTLFEKQIKILKKIIVNCCKKISYMINFYHNKVRTKCTTGKNNKLKTKEG